MSKITATINKPDQVLPYALIYKNKELAYIYKGIHNDLNRYQIIYSYVMSFIKENEGINSCKELCIENCAHTFSKNDVTYTIKYDRPPFTVNNNGVIINIEKEKEILNFIPFEDVINTLNNYSVIYDFYANETSDKLFTALVVLGWEGNFYCTVLDVNKNKITTDIGKNIIIYKKDAKNYLVVQSKHQFSIENQP